MDVHLRQVNICLNALNALKTDGRRTGISSPLTVQIDLCIAALEWVKDAMNLLAPPPGPPPLEPPGPTHTHHEPDAGEDVG